MGSALDMLTRRALRMGVSQKFMSERLAPLGITSGLPESEQVYLTPKYQRSLTGSQGKDKSDVCFRSQSSEKGGCKDADAVKLLTRLDQVETSQQTLNEKLIRALSDLENVETFLVAACQASQEPCLDSDELTQRVTRLESFVETALEALMLVAKRIGAASIVHSDQSETVCCSDPPVPLPVRPSDNQQGCVVFVGQH